MKRVEGFGKLAPPYSNLFERSEKATAASAEGLWRASLTTIPLCVRGPGASGIGLKCEDA